jgi:hypothetical protein
VINGGTPAPGDTALDLGLSIDDTVQCIITPSDGTDDGETISSDVLTVTGSLPAVTDATFTPEEPQTNDIISVSATASDPDGDEVALAYQWQVNGVTVPGDTHDLDGAAWFDKDDTITVIITPSDGSGDGTLFTLSTTVANTAPSSPEVQLEPETVRAGEDDVLCSFVSDSSIDPDEDDEIEAVEVSWTLNGEDWTGEVLTTDWAGDTLPAEVIEVADEWLCLLRVSDGTDWSDSDTVSFSPTHWTYSEDFSDCDDSTCGGSWERSGPNFAVSGGTLYSMYEDYGWITHDLYDDLGGPVQGDKWIFQFEVLHTLASGGFCSAAQSFWLHDSGESDVVGGMFQDYRAFQQYWEFRVEDDGSERGTTIHNWMTEVPPTGWTTFTVVRDGTTLTFTGDGRTRTATVTEDWGDDLRYLTLQSHPSTNCDPPTVVRIDDIEIRLGQTYL